jgi:threonine aldolase
MIDANKFVQDLNKLRVRVNPPRGRRVRMVTHYEVTREDIDYTLQSVKEVIGRQ